MTVTDSDDDRMTGGQLLATAGLCLAIMVVMVGAVLVANGVALPIPDAGGMNPLTGSDDVVDGKPMPDTGGNESDDDPSNESTGNETDENQSEADPPEGDDENDTGESPPAQNETQSDTDESSDGDDWEAGDPTLPGTDTGADDDDAGDGDGDPDPVDAPRDVTDEEDESNWSEEDRERAAKMLRAYLDGYHNGINHSVGTEIEAEAYYIATGTQEPWPANEWDSVEDARADGNRLGSSEGAGPLADEYRDRADRNDTATDDS